MLLNFINLIIAASLCDAITYDLYTGDVATDELLAKYNATGVTSTCTMEVAVCNATERRREDGSCNSLTNPVKGTYFEPLRRVLPARYYNGSYSRKSIDGSELTLPRVIRNALLFSGKANDLGYTQSITAQAIFTSIDVGSAHDVTYFLKTKPYCCTEKGKGDDDCTPNIIPEDDPVHRFSGIRCMNLTRPRAYADYGCTDDPVPSPIEQATGVYDLSVIYNPENKGEKSIRSFEGGKLIVDVDENGVVWPPNGGKSCANQPGETRCFKNYPTTLLSMMLFGIWYMRNHNYFASQLAAVSPCWDDETIYQTAKDMNIAFASQVYYYEWMPALVGSETLIENGVISNDSGFRDIYDNSSYPIVSLEYTYVLRWFHSMQECTANLYYPDGTYMKDFPYVNASFRPGLLGVNNNIVYFTPHMFRQSAAKIDYTVDPDLLERGLPAFQQAVDVLTSDLHKSRLLGMSPYIDYIQFCTGHNITSFKDLEKHIKPERIVQLKKVYKYPEDIDLMAGMWVENQIEEGKIPATLACLLMEYNKKAAQSDRHWYERSERPYAFTKDQLYEIRKSKLSLLLCNNADNVTEVQPEAFRMISTDNPLTPCSELSNIDFTKWADSSCSSTSTSDETTLSSTTSNDSTDSSPSSSSTSTSSTASDDKVTATPYSSSASSPSSSSTTTDN